MSTTVKETSQLKKLPVNQINLEVIGNVGFNKVFNVQKYINVLLISHDVINTYLKHLKMNYIFNVLTILSKNVLVIAITT